MYAKQPFWLSALIGLLWSATAPAAEYPDFVTLVERYSPAVVSIQTKSDLKERPRLGHPNIPENSPFFDYFKRFFDEMPPTPRPNHARRSVPASSFRPMVTSSPTPMWLIKQTASSSVYPTAPS
jgi:S1-C subfamily serine protease